MGLEWATFLVFLSVGLETKREPATEAVLVLSGGSWAVVGVAVVDLRTRLADTEDERRVEVMLGGDESEGRLVFALRDRRGRDGGCSALASPDGLLSELSERLGRDGAGSPARRVIRAREIRRGGGESWSVDGGGALGWLGLLVGGLTRGGLLVARDPDEERWSSETLRGAGLSMVEEVL